MFITRKPIIVEQLKEGVTYTECGALCTFEGRVRDTHTRKRVITLIYEAYRQCAEIEFKNIECELRQKYPSIHIRAEHRIGELHVGEIAVAICIWAPHRKEAFLACEYMIDEIKKRVPIWKHEYYEDSTECWVEC